MIRIQALSHRYAAAATPALTDISLNIGRGECWGLLGANGAGKTTLMSILCGLQEVQSGQVLFEGVPMQALSRRQRQQIGLVPQDFAFYPQLSVWDNMLFFAALYRQRDRAHLRRLLDEAGLAEHTRKAARHLSGGLKRRLNFAIGLINRPQLVFLDEITVGIDPQSRQFILDSVIRLNAAGVTVVYTSHYLQEIELLCRHIALLAQGRLVYQGELAELLQQPGAHVRFQTEPMLSAAELAACGAQLLPNGMAQAAATGDEAAALYAQLGQGGRQIRYFQQMANLQRDGQRPRAAGVSLSEILCVRHSMSTRSMNATQDQTHRFGGPGGTAAISHPGRAA